jgi:tetratricopeptide (TPR) repeat protein
MIARTLFITLALAGTAHAGDFDTGNKAAMAADFKGAAASFERSLAHGWAPGTLLDLGNAYASSGDVGHAILAYERARVLAPSDADIAANLAQARAEAGVTAPPRHAIDDQLAVLTSDDWTWLAVAGGVLMCAGLVALGWSLGRRTPRAMIVAGAVATLACSLAAARTAPSADRAIVVAKAQARLAPVATADPVFSAPAGEAVAIEQHHGDFVYVRDGDRSGWLPRTSVEPVIPR